MLRLEGRLFLDHIRLKLMPFHPLQASDPAPWDHAPTTLHEVYNSREQVVNAAAWEVVSKNPSSMIAYFLFHCMASNTRDARG